MLLSDEQRWPDDIEPLHVGLNDEEFADPLDQDRWTEGEVALLRAAGMQVVTPEEARAAFIPPDQLRPSRGHVVWDPPPARIWSPPPGHTTATDHRPGAGERAADLAP
jgi:hypothetical protein